MFLGESIVAEDLRYPMAGVFPIVFEMKKRPQAHGYTIAEIDKPNPFYPVGTILHGHEFHYSSVAQFSEGILEDSVFAMRRGKGIKDSRDGICCERLNHLRLTPRETVR